MTREKFFLTYWMSDWSWSHTENGKVIINDDAPDEAKESFKAWKAQKDVD